MTTETTALQFVPVADKPCTCKNPKTGKPQKCPSATDTRFLEARVVARFPEMECAVLCNGVIVFEDNRVMLTAADGKVQFIEADRAPAPHNPELLTELTRVRRGRFAWVRDLRLAHVCRRYRHLEPAPMMHSKTPRRSRRPLFIHCL